MHKHTIDWYKQLNLTSDAALAEKRWTTAQAVAKKLSRARFIQLLRLFLFVPSDATFTQLFTNELISLDPEFPVSHNTQELRLMAGLVMVTTLEKPSLEADAFALGLRVASFPDGRAQPVQPAVMAEAEEYLRNEANRIRPGILGTDIASEITKTLTARAKALNEAEATGDEAKKKAATTDYREAVARAIGSSHKELIERIDQIAEESALLWWVLGEYSDALQKPVSTLSPEAYALVAAAEAAQRTMHVPPPPSIGPLLGRVLKPCKASEKKLVLSDYVKASDPQWRAGHVKVVSSADCPAITPLCAALEKTEELGSAATALKALPKLCPGVKGELPLIPVLAAQQFYNEIIFLRALHAAGA